MLVTTSAAPRPDAPASPLAALREQLLAAGWSAESPAELDPEAQRLAREERWD